MDNSITLSHWSNPLGNVKPAVHGSARLTVRSHRAGLYRGGWYGVMYSDIREKWTEVSLDLKEGRRWVTYMSDAPVNTMTIQQDVRMFKSGSVLLGGLGLGLHLRYLASRSNISRIVVAELNSDVVELVRPTLPEDPRVQIVVGDFFKVAEESKMEFDNLHWDCFPGGSEFYEVVPPALFRLSKLRERFSSSCRIVFHGAPGCQIG